MPIEVFWTIGFYSVNKPNFGGSSPSKIEVANDIANKFGAAMYVNRIWESKDKAVFFISLDKVEVKQVDAKVRTEGDVVEQVEAEGSAEL